MNPYETDTLVAPVSRLPVRPEPLLGSPTTPRPWPVLPASCAVAMSGRWTSAAYRPCQLRTGRRFAHVDGVDYSARFIDVALALASQDSFLRGCRWRGELVEYCEARLSRHELGRQQADRVHFSQGMPATSSPGTATTIWCSASNLIDRLREPARSCGTSLPAFAAAACWCSPAPHLADRLHPKANWLGGSCERTARSSAPIRALQRLLAEEFEEHMPQGTSLRHPRDRPQVSTRWPSSPSGANADDAANERGGPLASLLSRWLTLLHLRHRLLPAVATGQHGAPIS